MLCITSSLVGCCSAEIHSGIPLVSSAGKKGQFSSEQTGESKTDKISNRRRFLFGIALSHSSTSFHVYCVKKKNPPYAACPGEFYTASHPTAQGEGLVIHDNNDVTHQYGK
ncbi:hypothetical protein K440DRAFT_611036 [Wilcoxina mikolae CBS 423.85]|nr:hypothetical protein K440DRAFT_611036 [Wilcoxina mikolae CBS 423.85]